MDAQGGRVQAMDAERLHNCIRVKIRWKDAQKRG